MIRTSEAIRKEVVEKYPCKEISIEVTEECHQKCIHCSSEAGDKWDNELAFHEIEQIIRMGKEFLGTEVVSLSGGDPTLRSDIVELVNLIVNDLKLNVLIYSSGVVLEPGHCEKVDGGYKGSTDARIPLSCTELFQQITKIMHSDDENNKMIYSLEGGNVFSHEFITRVQDSWNCLWQTIRDTLEEGIYTEIHTCPMTTNMNELEEMYDLLCKESVNRWSLLRLVPQGRASKADYLLTDQYEFRRLIGIIEKILFKQNELKAEGEFATEVRVGDPLNFFGCICGDDNPIIPMTTCNAAKNRLLIRANGETQFCAALKHSPHYDYGNVRKTNIVDLWCLSEMAQALRMFHESGYKNISWCEDCKNIEICKGGCLSQRIALYGDMMVGPDPLCPYNSNKSK